MSKKIYSFVTPDQLKRERMIFEWLQFIYFLAFEFNLGAMGMVGFVTNNTGEAV